jgi:hypothetical protein
MNHTEALEKAKKLLRLAQSDNPNEAALAASRAQEIIDRFKIEKFALEFEDNKPAAPDEPIKNFAGDPLDDSGRAETWKIRLAMELAKQNQCKIYSSGGLCIIGRPSDATAVRYLFAWLTREIDRLAREHCAGYGRNYWNNFRIGAADTVARRLAEQAEATRTAVRREATAEKVQFKVVNPDGSAARIFDDIETATIYEAERYKLDSLRRTIEKLVRPADDSRALMIVEKALANAEKKAADVEAWAKANMKLRAGSRRTYRGNYEAREAGRQAGHSVRMQPSAGNLKSGQKSLGI